jgi:3-phytase
LKNAQRQGAYAPRSLLIALRHALTCCACIAILLAATAAHAAEPVRVATFNLALFGSHAGEILERLQSGADPQARALAEVIQRVRPDVLVLNEIDFDEGGAVLDAFCDNYLAVGQNVSQSPAAAEPIEFPHRMAFAANTGEHSGFDLDRNGQVAATPGSRDYGADCFGYGVYPGQYAFAVLSKFPIDAPAVREFRKFLWKDMPGAMLPDDAATPAPGDWYSPEILAKFCLSSKNHCDVPVIIDGKRVHLLLSHPTPPVFDGAEDRNGRRNHDELRFWADYIGPADGSAYMIDDAGRRGGLGEDAGVQSSGFRIQPGPAASDVPPAASSLQPSSSFLILGDLNGDPHDGQGQAGISRLLAAPQVLKYPTPNSLGAVEAAREQGGANADHAGDPADDTEDAADERGPGNLRLDYLLPSSDMQVVASGVFWPESTDPLHALVVGAEHPASSDHRLVWIDLKVGE